jgi:hypothetical protein
MSQSKNGGRQPTLVRFAVSATSLCTRLFESELGSSLAALGPAPAAAGMRRII